MESPGAAIEADVLVASRGPQPKVSLLMRVLGWMVPDRRRSPRHWMPPLVSYLGIPGASKPYKVGDVSAAGFYMLTHERWMPGTYMPVSLERVDLFGELRGDFITVQACVVRNGPDGVGFVFLLADDATPQSDALTGARWVSKRRMEEFLAGLRPSVAEEEAGLERAS
ncbi:MAG TPA: hypothetical protein VK716_01780 [Terracidiphilus sp.]|nr:hypothetical protein [Terracidiphilus sp.]